MADNGASGRIRRRRLIVPLGVLALSAILIAACAQPGAVSSPAPSASVVAPSSAPSNVEPSASTAAAGPDCGTGPVELNAVFETGFPTVPALADEFSKQYPNVTFKVSQDQFANLINSTPRLLSRRQPAGPHPAADADLACQGRAAQEPR